MPGMPNAHSRNFYQQCVMLCRYEIVQLKLKIFGHTCSNKISGGEKPPMTQEQIEAIEKDAAARLALHKNPYFDKYADQINKMQR